MRPAIVVFLCVVLLTCGCSGGTSNGASNLNDPVPTAVFTAGGLGLFAGEPAQLMVSVTAGTPPYEVAIGMGGGADDVPAGTAVDAVSTHDFTLAEGGPYTYIVTVTDDAGRTGSCTGDYGPVGPAQNHAPAITDIAFTGGMLAVAVDDPDGDDPLTVSVAEVPGLVPSVLTQQVGNKSSALFTYKLIEGFDPAELDVTVTVSDGKLESAESVTAAANTPLLEVPAGHLAAIPLRQVVNISETATILVRSGDFPADAPFAFMNGVGITLNEGVELEDFNYGSVGGDDRDVDGIFAAMDPQPQTFFIPMNFWMMFTDVEGSDPPLEFLGANITPIGAGQVTSGGDLFNIEVSFEHTGVYDIGFLEFQDVKRTYYADAEATEHNWADISNDIPGLPNTITVVE